MHRIDLHTHSVVSPDGGLSAEDYRNMLHSGRLQTVAVTDHNRIDFAVKLRAELGDAIIVGEEIATHEGEVIGLYLQEAIPAGLTAGETAKRIHEQGGFVYIPHPFETVRKGLSPEALEQIAELVDIIETYNGRALQDTSAKAAWWATEHSVLCASSSDAHGRRGWGSTASVVVEPPARETLLRLLHTAGADRVSTGFAGRLYPTLNRLKKGSRRA